MPSDISYLTVSLPAVIENWRAFAQRCPGGCGATVKANAYGLGVEAVAPALAKAGCRTFFVATLSEGIALRHLLPEPDIFVFSGLREEDVTAFHAHALCPVLNSAEEVALWEQAGGGKKAALHIDTAMSRLGLDEADTMALSSDISRLEKGGVALVMSHIACADTPEHQTNALQKKSFEDVTKAFAPLKTSFGNSGGILNGTAFCGDMARPGIGLYGGHPNAAAADIIASVVSWTAPILQTRTISAGTPIGYGSTFVAERTMTIATLGAGYADGLKRSISGKGHVTIAGQKCPLLGRISMDSCVVDVSACDPLEKVSTAQLLGDISITQMADWAGTIDYEILTGISPRVERRYISA
ncbi:MAG: alanine racemase [Pseudomonadota bacterium]